MDDRIWKNEKIELLLFLPYRFISHLNFQANATEIVFKTFGKCNKQSQVLAKNFHKGKK